MFVYPSVGGADYNKSSMCLTMLQLILAATDVGIAVFIIPFDFLSYTVNIPTSDFFFSQ